MNHVTGASDLFHPLVVGTRTFIPSTYCSDSFAKVCATTLSYCYGSVTGLDAYSIYPMSIQELSSATVRIIGSSQVLSDPASVVKELIDNAIDARASTVSVEIAANSLDVVQVRDNGHGVAPQDRDVICKRYCTSKIRDYADLKEVGGRWLGFRGEALASASELSGSFVITTRVEGEDCAASLEVDQKGRVER